MGPGSYTPKEVDNSRKVDFGKLKPREERIPDKERGPGHYHQEPVACTKNMTIGVKRSPAKKSPAPGPGEYNPKVEQSSPAIDFSKRSYRKYIDKDSDCKQAPGQYDLPEYRMNKITIG